MSFRFSQNFLRIAIGTLVGWGVFPISALAQNETICVRVRIEIEQELTLERQAFEARMNIRNGTPNALEDFNVAVNFQDEEGNPVLATSDPDDSSAAFFIRLSSHPSLPASIGAEQEERLRWLIIPAQSAGGETAEGTLYFVGATVNYTEAGQETQVDVSPDTITVAPMPDLVLDYFLPNQVYGDDPFTSPIEEPVPFPLGVRVKNQGYGPAVNLKIDSGQPKIVENELGLLIEFLIIGSEVNGQSFAPSLLADFGTIEPQASGIAAWVMTSTLNGRFIEFDATFTHEDSLGGELTSLISEVNTHLILSDVEVDLPGRDARRDFLALDGDTLVVFESDNVDSPVLDVSDNANLSGFGGNYTVEVPPAAGFFYAQVADPLGNSKEILSVVRSDGKILPARNAWLSRDLKLPSRTYDYWINIFDAENPAGASYAVIMGDPEVENRAPELQSFAHRFVRRNTAVTAPVVAVDPDGTTPLLDAPLLPLGAGFADNGNGTGTFAWTPNREGTFPVQFRANDGFLDDRRTAAFTVAQENLRQAWREHYFAGETDPAIIGDDADPDGDGITNLFEYALGLDPTSSVELRQPRLHVVWHNNERYLGMTYYRNMDDPDLQFEVVADGDINIRRQNWGMLVGTMSTPDQAGTPPGLLRVTVRDSMPIGQSSNRYFALRVTSSEDAVLLP